MHTHHPLFLASSPTWPRGPSRRGPWEWGWGLCPLRVWIAPLISSLLSFCILPRRFSSKRETAHSLPNLYYFGFFFSNHEVALHCNFFHERWQIWFLVTKALVNNSIVRKTDFIFVVFKTLHNLTPLTMTTCLLWTWIKGKKKMYWFNRVYVTEWKQQLIQWEFPGWFISSWSTIIVNYLQ